MSGRFAARRLSAKWAASRPISYELSLLGAGSAKDTYHRLTENAQSFKPQVTHRHWSPCVDHDVAYAQSLVSLPLKEAFSSHHCRQAITSANTLLAAETRYVALVEEEFLLIAKFA
jgi:hypothetical protein